MDEKLTLLKYLDEGLQISPAQYCNLIEKIPFPIVLSSVKDNRCLYMNQRAADLFEITDKQNLNDYIHNYYVNPHKRQQLVDSLRTKGPVQNFEVIMKTKSGLLFYALISSKFTIFKDELAVCSVFNDITDRKRVEEELRGVHRRLDQIIEFLPDATFVIDRKGKVIAWNRAIEKMTGVPKNDIIGKGNYEYSLPFYGEKRMLLADLVLMPDEDPKERNYDAVQSREDVLYAELYAPKLYENKGAYLWGTASLLHDAEGNITGAIESIRDITERKHMEELLKNSEKKYRNIFENATEGIFQSTIEGRYVSLNPAFARIRGFSSPQEMIDMSADIQKQTYVHIEDRIKMIELLNKQGFVKNYEVEARRKDGTIIWISMNAKPIRDESGNIILLEGTITDITERKRTEEALRESEGHYRNIIENILDVYYRSDKEGVLIMISPSGATLLGYNSPDELLGKRVADILYFTPEDRNRTLAILREKGSVRDFEVILKHKNGTPIPVSTSSRYYYNEDGDILGIDGIFRDIRDRKQTEEALLRARKLESLGVLAGGIAHDFNNLMTMVQGYIDLALLDMPADHVSHERLQAAMQSVEHTKDLTNRLITFSRGGDPHREFFDVAGIIRDAVNRTVKGTKVSVKFDFGENLCPARVDEFQMKQVFYNLTANAVEAMPEGGFLIIQAKNTLITDGEVFDLKKGSYLKIIFTDEGIGIREEHLSKIFDPYFTTKKMAAQKGLGLGLAVCYSILKKHGGNITVQPQPGKGASFVLYLPVRIDPAEKKNN